MWANLLIKKIKKFAKEFCNDSTCFNAVVVESNSKQKPIGMKVSFREKQS